jgi:hypothetical protein
MWQSWRRRTTPDTKWTIKKVERHLALLPPSQVATFSTMYVVTEADAAAIREVYERDGELSTAIELRRRFPGIQDNAKAREQARAIAW